MGGEMQRNWWCRANKDTPMLTDVFTAVLQTIRPWTVQRCWLSLPEGTSYKGRICATTALVIIILCLHVIQDPATTVDSGIIHLFVKEEFQLFLRKAAFLHQQKRTWALQLGLRQLYTLQCEQWSMDRKQESWLTQEFLCSKKKMSHAVTHARLNIFLVACLIRQFEYCNHNHKWRQTDVLHPWTYISAVFSSLLRVKAAVRSPHHTTVKTNNTQVRVNSWNNMSGCIKK